MHPLLRAQLLAELRDLLVTTMPSSKPYLEELSTALTEIGDYEEDWIDPGNLEYVAKPTERALFELNQLSKFAFEPIQEFNEMMKKPLEVSLPIYQWIGWIGRQQGQYILRPPLAKAGVGTLFTTKDGTRGPIPIGEVKEGRVRFLPDAEGMVRAGMPVWVLRDEFIGLSTD